MTFFIIFVWNSDAISYDHEQTSIDLLAPMLSNDTGKTETTAHLIQVSHYR